jgi:hypothetical protein
MTMRVMTSNIDSKTLSCLFYNQDIHGFELFLMAIDIESAPATFSTASNNRVGGESLIATSAAKPWGDRGGFR